MIALVLKPMNDLSFVLCHSEHIGTQSPLKWNVDSNSSSCSSSSSNPLALLLMHTCGHAYTYLNACMLTFTNKDFILHTWLLAPTLRCLPLSITFEMKNAATVVNSVVCSGGVCLLQWEFRLWWTWLEEKMDVMMLKFSEKYNEGGCALSSKAVLSDIVCWVSVLMHTFTLSSSLFSHNSGTITFYDWQVLKKVQLHQAISCCLLAYASNVSLY